MITGTPKGAKPRVLDKAELERVLAEANARMGFERDPDATALRSLEMMLNLGIRPEENAFSREIVRLRYEATKE
ncbi:MAG TPA: hypothetical protein VGM37_05600 [Armatimonadota bacterium]|jgi:hypothetical protein